MPKPVAKTHPIRMQILGGLIETKTFSRKHKTVVKVARFEGDTEGREDIVTSKVTREGLRYPLAQNVSDLNVERAAKRWAA